MSRPDQAPSFVDIESDKVFMEIHKACDPYTMTPIEVQYALYQACKYIVQAGINDSFVECGVWRGGSAMIAAKTLLALKKCILFKLYDTYEGMTEPGKEDINYAGVSGDRLYKSRYLVATLDEVKRNFRSTGYPDEPIVSYIKGDIRKTIPDKHERISILRLDTDFYDSTKIELEKLYPCLVPGGVLIIDDVGHWQGSAKAMEEYFADKPNVFFNRVNYSCRLAIKP